MQGGQAASLGPYHPAEGTAGDIRALVSKAGAGKVPPAHTSPPGSDLRRRFTEWKARPCRDEQKCRGVKQHLWDPITLRRGTAGDIRALVSKAGAGKVPPAHTSPPGNDLRRRFTEWKVRPCRGAEMQGGHAAYLGPYHPAERTAGNVCTMAGKAGAGKVPRTRSAPPSGELRWRFAEWVVHARRDLGVCGAS